MGREQMGREPKRNSPSGRAAPPRGRPSLVAKWLHRVAWCEMLGPGTSMSLRVPTPGGGVRRPPPSPHGGASAGSLDRPLEDRPRMPVRCQRPAGGARAIRLACAAKLLLVGLDAGVLADDRWIEV